MTVRNIPSLESVTTVGKSTTLGIDFLGSNVKGRFGDQATFEADVYHDGTDFILDPSVLGSGIVKIGPTANKNLQAYHIGLGDTVPAANTIIAGSQTSSTTPSGFTMTLNYTGASGTMRTMLFRAEHAGSAANQISLGGSFTGSIMNKNAGTATVIGLQGVASTDANIGAGTTNLYNEFSVTDASAGAHTAGTVNARSVWGREPPAFTGVPTVRRWAGLFEGQIQVNSDKKLILGGGNSSEGVNWFIFNSASTDIDIVVGSTKVMTLDNDRIDVVAVPFNLNPQAAPTPVVGDMWYDSTKKHFRDHHDIAQVGRGGVVSVSTADSTEISNTTTETNFSTNFAIPANTLTVGTVIRLVAHGKYSTDAVTAGNVTVRVKLGSTTLNTMPATTLSAGTAEDGWKVETYFTVRTIGATGTVISNTEFTLEGKTALAYDDANTGTITIDTTASQTLQISVQMSVADVDNKFTCQQFYVGLN